MTDIDGAFAKAFGHQLLALVRVPGQHRWLSSRLKQTVAIVQCQRNGIVTDLGVIALHQLTEGQHTPCGRSTPVFQGGKVHVIGEPHAIGVGQGSNFTRHVGGGFQQPRQMLLQRRLVHQKVADWGLDGTHMTNNPISHGRLHPIAHRGKGLKTHFFGDPWCRDRLQQPLETLRLTQPEVGVDHATNGWPRVHTPFAFGSQDTVKTFSQRWH